MPELMTEGAPRDDCENNNDNEASFPECLKNNVPCRTCSWEINALRIEA